MEDIGNYLEILRRIVQRMGPYVFIELVMPGGSLLALALFLYRRRQGTRLAPGRWGDMFPGLAAMLASAARVSTTTRSDR
jgi:hypothetical protein